MSMENDPAVGGSLNMASAIGRKTLKSASDAAGTAAKSAGSSAAIAGKAISNAAVRTVALSKQAATMTSEAALAGVTIAGDLNGDGKLDMDDLRIARQAGAQAITVVGSETAELSKSVIRSDMMKQAATGAALGAVIAIPIPVIGSAIGASIGAVIGMWRSATKPEITIQTDRLEPKTSEDALAVLEKLHQMMQEGIITREDFERQKTKLLR